MRSPSSRSTSSSPAHGWQARLPFFYGWVVVASAFLVLAVGYGVYYSFSVFYVALLEEFGWSRAATAGVFSVHIMTVGIGGVWAGRVVDRFGPSRVVPAGTVLLAAGLVASSALTELWQFYLSFGLLAGFGLAICGWVPAVAMVSAWFSAKRGLAIGIASAGIGLGTVFFAPLGQHLISTIGWRSAYLVFAALTLLVATPQSALLQIGRPDKLGLRPDGGAPAPAPAARRRGVVIVDRTWASFPWTVATAIRTGRFWFMTGVITLTTATNQMLWAHQAAYLVDTGYDKMLAASTVGLAGVISMPAKIMWGEASDRFGRERTFTLGVATMLCAIAVLVALGMFPSMPLVLLFALTFALGYAINAPLSPAAAGDLFGGRSFGTIFGVMNLGVGLGGAFGAWIAGFVFDATGSYHTAFAIAATCSTMAAVCLWLAAPRKVRRVLKGEVLPEPEE